MIPPNDGDGSPHEEIRAAITQPSARRRKRPAFPLVNLREVDTFSTDSIDDVLR